MTGLNAEQREVLAALVGKDVAHEDEAAVEAAYADFRTGMEGLKEALDGGN